VPFLVSAGLLQKGFHLMGQWRSKVNNKQPHTAVCYLHFDCTSMTHFIACQHKKRNTWNQTAKRRTFVFQSDVMFVFRGFIHHRGGNVIITGRMSSSFFTCIGSTAAEEQVNAGPPDGKRKLRENVTTVSRRTDFTHYFQPRFISSKTRQSNCGNGPSAL